MKIEHLKSIEPGNPYKSDLYHMGTQIGKNVIVMYANHTSEQQDYIIIVNPETGERIKIVMNQ